MANNHEKRNTISSFKFVAIIILLTTLSIFYRYLTSNAITFLPEGLFASQKYLSILYVDPSTLQYKPNIDPMLMEIEV